MKSTKVKKPSVRKNIDLPIRTVKKLQKCADDFRMKLKPYIELVLMDFAEDDVPFPMHKNRLSDKKKSHVANNT